VRRPYVPVSVALSIRRAPFSAEACISGLNFLPVLCEPVFAGRGARVVSLRYLSFLHDIKLGRLLPTGVLFPHPRTPGRGLGISHSPDDVCSRRNRRRWGASRYARAAIDGGSCGAQPVPRRKAGLHDHVRISSVTARRMPFIMVDTRTVGLPGSDVRSKPYHLPLPGNSRSYVGLEICTSTAIWTRRLPIFELVPKSIAALTSSAAGCGRHRIGRGPARCAGGADSFPSNVRGWLSIDRDIGSEVARHIRDRDPDFVFAALTGIDKTSHSAGHDAPIVLTRCA